jgi:uncharacterized YceG family protein
VVVAVAIAIAAVVVAIPHVHKTKALPPPPPPPKPFRVIFPEGFTRKQMAQRVTVVAQIARRKRGKPVALNGAAYLRVSRRGRISCFTPKVQKNLEGFLFPATYDFLAATAARRLVADQVQAFCTNWRSVNLAYAKSKNLTAYDVLIIASMVEKETLAPAERPLVAAVIYNRLKAGMPLGIDATIRYATNNWSRPLRASELAIDSPYNTRKRTGLPPTPIGNPGLAAIRAAAQPANVGYIYYVVKPGTCGKHAFSSTDTQFEQDRLRYDAARAQAGGKSPTTC